MRSTARCNKPSWARVVAGLCLVGLVLTAMPATSGAASSETYHQLVYHGESFEIPAGWRTYNLAATPSVCARLNRHAAYEGAATSAGACPPQEIGLAAAMQVQPLDSSLLARASVADGLASRTINGQSVMVSTDSAVTHRIVAAFPQSGVLATFSFRTSSGQRLAARILDSASSRETTSSPASPVSYSAGLNRATPPPATLTSSISDKAPRVGPAVYTGKGFDTCDAPSEGEMAAWRAHSPFSGVGVYIGGINAACDNVTAKWLADEAEAGWYTFPIYVGLQAPCANQANLAPISTKASTAAAQGSDDAKDAVAQAASLGISAGSTIYDDMEAWNTSAASCNNAVLSFIKAWTNTLHADGYKSGMYGSLYSGINVLESLYGHAGAPDVVYFACWDGVATTASSDLPAADWPGHKRIKQYATGTFRYGGVSLDIDEDYLDAPALGKVTSAGGGGTAPTSQPAVHSLSPSAAPVGTTVILQGQKLGVGSPSVTFGSVTARNVRVLSPSKITAVVPSQSAKSVKVTVTTGSGTTIAPQDFTYEPVVSVSTTTSGGYLLTSSVGNVLNYGASWYGSTAGRRLPAPVVGIATTATGYLLVTSKGNVYAFHTSWRGSLAGRTLPSPIVGVASASPGYRLVSASGQVYNFAAPNHGSVAGAPPTAVVSIADTSRGYLLATSAGQVYAFGSQ